MHLILPLMAAALITAASESRHPVGEQRTIVVKTDDLDLTQLRDVRRLDLRIARAAQTVCGETSDWDLAGLNAISRCRSKTIAELARIRSLRIAIARRKTF